METKTSAMSKTMDWFIEKYAESHQNPTNKLIHWLCVPAIMFSLFGLLYSIPFPVERSLFANWASISFAIALLYYLRLSIPMFIGFLPIGLAILFGNNAIFESVGRDVSMMVYISLAIFAIAWVVQFIGHKIEGAKPSFIEDVQFLMIGPAWILHFIYKKIGIKY